jgi:hypothetical protein
MKHKSLTTVSRRVATNGVVCVSWQQVSVDRHYAGARCDVHVDTDLREPPLANLCSQANSGVKIEHTGLSTDFVEYEADQAVWLGGDSDPMAGDW